MASRDLFKPVWKEGMFLAPQHLQQADRYNDAVSALRSQAIPPFLWGIGKIEIDENLLSAYQFSVQRLEAVLTSEEVVSLPGNLEIPSRSFEGILTEPQQVLKVSLGIPDYELDGPNLHDGVSHTAESTHFRYGVREMVLVDENTGVTERTIQVRQIRGRLFFEGEDTQGYQLLPLARIQLSPKMEGAVLDDDFTPPVLQIAASPALQKRIESLAARLTLVQSNLMRSLGAKGIAEWCGSPRGIELVLKIQAVNQAAFVVHQISNVGSLPPFFAYSELLRAIGLFWSFKGEIAFGKVPLYDHLQIGANFKTVVDVLRQLCGILDAQGYIRRPFVKKSEGLDIVDLDAEWLTGTRKLYLCVSGIGDYAQVISRMESVRVSAPSHFERVLQRRIQALQLQWLRRSPSSLPAAEGSTYAEIMQSGKFWPGVVEEMALVVGSSEKIPYRLELFVE